MIRSDVHVSHTPAPSIGLLPSIGRGLFLCSLACSPGLRNDTLGQSVQTPPHSHRLVRRCQQQWTLKLLWLKKWQQPLAPQRKHVSKRLTKPHNSRNVSEHPPKRQLQCFQRTWTQISPLLICKSVLYHIWLYSEVLLLPGISSITVVGPVSVLRSRLSV